VIFVKTQAQQDAPTQDQDIFIGVEVLSAVVTNAAIFWDIAECSPYVNRRFGGTYHFNIQGRKSEE
jgi:hypothetical protein